MCSRKSRPAGVQTTSKVGMVGVASSLSASSVGKKRTVIIEGGVEVSLSSEIDENRNCQLKLTEWKSGMVLWTVYLAMEAIPLAISGSERCASIGAPP